MKFARLLTVFVLFSLTSFNVFAQTQATETGAAKEEKEKARAELEKKALALVERATDDATLLKLPENRALVYATAGDLFWTKDEKRARTLFQRSADELVAANAEAEKAEGDNPISAFQSVEPRFQILQMIARRDADLATSLMQQTRSARLQAEMQKVAGADPAAQTGNAGGSPTGSDGKYLVEREMRLEQSFAAIAAENNPERAVKMIKESLAKNGVTTEIFRLLFKINQKDEKAAQSLLGDVVQKMLETDFAKKDAERRTAYSFLMQFSRPAPAETKQKWLKADDKMLRDVAGKVADYFMQTKNFRVLTETNYVMPTLEKLLPERVAALRQKQASLKNSGSEDMPDIDAVSAINRPDVAPEDVIKNAAKVQPFVRGYAYERLVRQLVSKGEAERARQLLNEAPAGAEREKALAYLDAQIAEKAVRDGKQDEAGKLIDKIANKNVRAEKMVQLARSYHAKNTKEDRETALKLIEDARRLLDDTPQDEDEINAMLAIAAGYALIEPERAFTFISPLVDQTNEILQAAALLAKYNKRDRRFRAGEMTYSYGMGQMRFRFMRFAREIASLAETDFERARSLTDKFQRPDAQVIARLVLAQSVLQKPASNEGDENAFVVFGEE